MSELTGENLGLPIYSDSRERDISDPASEASNPLDWQPASQLTAKLWRCLETMRDVQELLESAKTVSNPKKQRRRLKILATPILSLAENVRSLCNSLATDPGLESRVTVAERKYFQSVREAFDRDVPIDSKSILKTIRNKLSAHVDHKLWPKDARGMIEKTSPKLYGKWLHGCIFVIQEIIQLNVFSWRLEDGPEGSIRLMNVEPWILTVAKGGAEEEVNLAGLHVSSSPRLVVLRACEDIVRESQWLFGAGDERLVLLDSSSPREAR